MTVYNDLRFLEEAVQGILGQSFTEFEFIVIDNGSSFPEVFQGLAARDSRVRVFRIEENLGPTGAGNHGIAMARAPVIARMDGDDVAEPGWLTAVMEAFAADDELGLVGTWVNLITEHGDPIGTYRTPVSDFAIRLNMMSHNPFCHSSTAYRRALYDRAGGERAYALPTYELGLWRAMLPHCRVRNLPQALVRYRYNTQGVTSSWAPGDSRSRARHIRFGLWSELGLDYLLEDVALAECYEDFLRDEPCRHPGLWPGLRPVLEAVQEATLAHRNRFVRLEELISQRSYLACLIERHDRGPKLAPGMTGRLLKALRLRGGRRTLAAAIRRLTDRR